jgi:flagellar basal body-associated protein FliL
MATAEKPAHAPAPAPPATPAPPKKSKLPVVIVLGLMAVEGVGIFAITKFLLVPTPAGAHAETAEDEGHAAPEFDEHGGHGSPQGKLATAEVDLAECRPSNTQTGKLVIFKIRISGLIKQEDAERATALIEANKAKITDRVNYVFRSAVPPHVSEPGLDTIKRRLKREVDAILGDEHLIQEILVPEMLQSSSGL